MWQDAKTLNATANALLALVMLVCVAAGVWWLAQRPMFTLRMIRVESMQSSGLRHVNHLTLRSATLGRIKGNFFTANLDSVRQAFESVPWVRRATVRREWPNQLIVTLDEHEALGTWGEDGRLLSVKGDVFTANLAEAEDDHVLPEFFGPDGSEKDVLATFALLRKWFAPIKLVPESLSLSSRYAWTVKLDNGMSVALGREQTRSTLKERVDRLVGIYPQLASRLDNIDTIDMRYQNGLALSSAGLVIPAEGKKSAALKKKPNNLKPIIKNIQ
ncbi:cell division protein FtsQ/DivIB [Janthinobacterium agaricidamnosum]|uniref:Cell division protein FtsQ n=1 Tax=Janthinobacterium agaricidamnosum NBRC 102515 = DSM 9628 TaxID=1349767 RepID=W0V8D3_9BURK|nr:cell division protein FtsQ/DivIB [Janthinobacterium agaricidamnosum]CDG85079.1 cell division FtsQ family protein [Janthinobacterium agaricidamnosum NBRC 102515 = DSM 9628]